MDALDLGSEKIAEQSYQSISKGKKWEEEAGKSRWRGVWREGVRGEVRSILLGEKKITNGCEAEKQQCTLQEGRR